MTSNRMALLSLSAAVGALLPAAVAWAEESPARPSAQASEVAEIVVTAQKREQTLQEIPAAVSALSGETLAQRGVNDLLGLQSLTPSLRTGNFLGDTKVSIRGVGMNQVGAAVQPGVAVHSDGVYLARSGLGGLSQIDLARVEVLRGPQGTLYGRNATGGAVNFISNAPTHQLEGYGLAGYGNYDAYHLQGLVNIPLGERVRARAVVDYQDQGQGFVENVIPGGPDVGSGHALTGRLKIDADLTSQATLGLTLFGLKGGGPTDYLVLRDPPSALAVAANPYMAGMRPPAEPQRTSANFVSSSDRKAAGAIATFDWDLGAAKLKSISSYISFDFSDAYDADGSQLDVFRSSNQNKSDTFTQEFDLSGRAAGLDWVVGAFYMDDKLKADTSFTFPLGLNIPVLSSQLLPGAFLVLNADPYKTRSYAVFADGTYGVTDHLKLLAGARYSKEDQEVVQTSLTGPLSTPFGVFPVFPSCIDLETKKSFESFTPRGGVQYDFDSSKNAYFTVSRGFKSGGINASVCGNIYQPEKITAYEGGLRTRLFSNALTLNATAFYYDYTNFQVQQIQGLSAPIVNAPKATVKGLEIEADWTPDAHWAVNGSISLLDSTYGQFTNLDTLNPLAGPQNLKGNRLNYSPEASGNVGVQYRTLASSMGRITARADLYLTSKYYLREFNTAADSQSGYGLLNLNLIWDSPSERYAVRLFAMNATDEDYITTLGSSDNLGSRYVTWGTPAQYGVELKARF